MNKSQLVDAIASKADLVKADATRAVDAFMEAVQGALKKGDNVALVGFGTFAVGKRAARSGRNPLTGEAIKIPAKKVVKFRVGASFKKAVNKK